MKNESILTEESIFKYGDVVEFLEDGKFLAGFVDYVHRDMKDDSFVYEMHVFTGDNHYETFLIEEYKCLRLIL